MNKHIKKVLGVVLAVCLMCVCVVTPVTAAISSSAFATRESIVAALDALVATEATTAANIESAVTSVGSATVTWKVPFTKVLPTDGAIIKVNGVAEPGGVVRAHDGYIKGLLGITTGGATFDVPVNYTLAADYEDINCTKKATINTLANYDSSNPDKANSRYDVATGYDSEADLVIIDRTGGDWNISNNYFKDNSTVKAVIVKTVLSSCADSAFISTSALEAVVFAGFTSFQTNTFRTSAVKYVDFGEKAADLSIGANAFSYCRNLKNLYIGGFNAVAISAGAFDGDSNVNQIVIDQNSVSTIDSNGLRTNYEASKGSITTVVCNNATVASAFASSAAATVNISGLPIVDYYSAVSALKVRKDATIANVAAAVSALDTGSAFDTTVTKSGDVFEVSITDANSVTATAYLSATATVQSLIDEYNYTAGTTNADIINYVNSTVGATYDITWIENYSATEKVNGARVYAKANESSAESLYGTVPGQDSVAHGAFVYKNSTTCGVVEINKTIEVAEYEDYHLTGIQNNAGAGGGIDTDNYDGSSELVIIRNTTLWAACYAATSIDGYHGAGASDNIKAVIVNGVFNDNWSCFAGLQNLEVVIINNTNVTRLGNSQFASCPKLKYIYLPDSITTTTTGSDRNSHAFYNSCDFTVLVAKNFDFNTNYPLQLTNDNGVRTLATGVARYAENAATRKLIDFYDALSNIIFAPTESELEDLIEAIPNYSDYTIDIEQSGLYFNVTIDGSLVAVIPSTLIKSHSLVLTDAIGVNFFVDLSKLTAEEKAACYVTFSITQGGGSPVDGKRANYDSTFVGTANGYYGFTCYVNSVQMAESITPTLHYSYGGEEKTLAGAEYSVKDYIDYVNANTGKFSTQVINLANAIGNYGYYAQQRFTSKTFTPLNSSYSVSYTSNSYNTKKSAVTDHALIGDNGLDGIVYEYGAAGNEFQYNLNLDSTTSILVKFNTGHVNFTSVLMGAEDYTDRKNAYTANDCTLFLLHLPISKLGNKITVSGTADGNEFTIPISGLSYIYGILQISNSENSKNLVSALYDYYASAMAYISSIPVDGYLNTEYV